jgi:Xaa-Pro aminopeptidase
LLMRWDVDRFLAEHKLESLLLYSDSFSSANMYYLTRFLAPDPFIFLKKVDEDPILIIGQLELARAKKESRVKDVRSYFDYDFMSIVRSASDWREGVMKFVASAAKKELGAEASICVPPNLSVILADALRKAGLKIKPVFDVVEKARETKEEEEIEAIASVQKTVEEGTGKIIDMIATADPGPKGNLYFRENGKKRLLTAGKLRSVLDHVFVDRGCVDENDSIIACGPYGAMGHYFGKPGDVLKTNETVVLDIFPKNASSRYFSDMTRTVVKGRAPKEIKNMFETVLQARDAALDAIKAGVISKDMQILCCNIFEKAGYETIRGGKQVVKGYNHSLGHGVGLEVHEGPGMGEMSKFPLEEHNIVTVEPGLYDPKIGGVRIEDIVEVTKKGCRNLTEMEINLEV